MSVFSGYLWCCNVDKQSGGSPFCVRCNGGCAAFHGGLSHPLSDRHERPDNAIDRRVAGFVVSGFGNCTGIFGAPSGDACSAPADRRYQVVSRVCREPHTRRAVRRYRAACRGCACGTRASCARQDRRHRVRFGCPQRDRGGASQAQTGGSRRSGRHVTPGRRHWLGERWAMAARHQQSPYVFDPSGTGVSGADGPASVTAADDAAEVRTITRVAEAEARKERYGRGGGRPNGRARLAYVARAGTVTYCISGYRSAVSAPPKQQPVSMQAVLFFSAGSGTGVWP